MAEITDNTKDIMTKIELLSLILIHVQWFSFLLSYKVGKTNEIHQSKLDEKPQTCITTMFPKCVKLQRTVYKAE